MKRLIFLMLTLLFMAGCAVGAALPAEPEICLLYTSDAADE